MPAGGEWQERFLLRPLKKILEPEVSVLYIHQKVSSDGFHLATMCQGQSGMVLNNSSVVSGPSGREIIIPQNPPAQIARRE